MLARTLEETLLRLDGFANSVTGLGTLAFDKTVSALFHRTDRKLDQYYSGLYEEDPFARKVCEKLPEEMLRGGFDLSMGASDNALDLVTAILDELKRLKAKDRIKSGLVWERVHGGSAVFIGADDGATDPVEPLNEGTLKRLTHLTVVDKTRIWARTWYPSTHEKAGQVEIWSVTPLDTGAPTDIHETRLLIFPGGRVTHERRLELQGWGASVLASLHDILRDYSMSWQGISHMTQSVNQDVWHMGGLRAALGSGTAAAVEYFKSRFQMGQMKMGPNRAITLDTDEKFERHGSTFTGIPETMVQMAIRVAACAGMPVTVLFGTSPAGMNATGESDLQLWHSSVAAEREDKAEPHYERLIELIMVSSAGPTNGKVVEGWGIKFHSLTELSEPERVNMRKEQAEADHIAIEDGVLTPEEVTMSRYRPEGYSTETTVDLGAREDILKAEQEARLEAVRGARSPEALPAPGDPPAPGGTGGPAVPGGPGGPGGEQISKLGLNGAQMKSVLDIVEQFNGGVLALESAIELITQGLPTISPESARIILGTRIERRRDTPKQTNLPPDDE